MGLLCLLEDPWETQNTFREENQTTGEYTLQPTTLQHGLNLCQTPKNLKDWPAKPNTICIFLTSTTFLWQYLNVSADGIITMVTVTSLNCSFLYPMWHNAWCPAYLHPGSEGGLSDGSTVPKESVVVQRYWKLCAVVKGRPARGRCGMDSWDVQRNAHSQETLTAWSNLAKRCMYIKKCSLNFLDANW